MKAYNQISQSAGYKADDISVSLTVCGGSYGGGSEVLICGQVSTEKSPGHSIPTTTEERDRGGGESER